MRSSGLESVTQAAVSQSAYTHGMKEDIAHTVGGSHEDFSVR
jgi:hypothetical protein